jgi:formylglycine-generating enzyme
MNRTSEPPLRARSHRLLIIGGSIAALHLLAATQAESEAQASAPSSAVSVPSAIAVTALPGILRLPDSRLAQAPQAEGRPWTLREGKYWQIASTDIEATEVTDAREGNRGTCLPGMVEVKGAMKTHPTHSIDAMQLAACTKWISHEFPERCAEYDRAKWLAISASLPSKEEHFCMDRFEYPNQKGAYPYVMVTWMEAKDMCKAQGKRLCSEEEWTFACEGEEATPYPTGYSRDSTQCVIDEPWGMPKEGSLLPRDTERAKEEIERVFHGAVSGSERSCKSAAGIYDMTGNVDEWTHSSQAGERPSILKGGYFGPVRTRCRPATRAHNEWHLYYQEGFRCCSDAG